MYRSQKLLAAARLALLPFLFVPAAHGASTAELAPAGLDVADATAAQIEIRDLRHDPVSETVEIVAENVSPRSITAWGVELLAIGGDGAPLSAVRLVEDFGTQGAVRGLRLEPAAAHVEHRSGPWLPGQSKRTFLSLSVPDAAGPAEGYRLSTPVLIFDDRTHVGEDQAAAEIFAGRRELAAELGRWQPELQEILESADEPAELAAGLQRLREAIHAAGEDGHFQSLSARRNLVRNIDAELELLQTSPERAAETIELVSRDLRTQRRTVERSSVSALPLTTVPHAPAIRPKTEDPPSGGDDPSCECGGSITMTSAVLETKRCNGGQNWIVDENWSSLCRTESGTQNGSESQTLPGRGGCTLGYLCYPDLSCPPEFSVPSEWTTVDGLRKWSRSVINYYAALGACTARCLSDSSSATVTFTCFCSPRPDPSCAFDGCPVLIETGAGGFRLTDLDGGVRFDLDGDGSANRVSWTVGDGDDAWLALDRNGNGIIDSGIELFGDRTPQRPSDEPNGFLALGVFDDPGKGGDGDGLITPADAVWERLLLWVDRDHDGFSDGDELSSLGDAGIAALELEYFRSARTDPHGNEFRYSARVHLEGGGQRLATDVFLHLEPTR